MVFFMVFHAYSKEENIDTMLNSVMLAWYQPHCALPVWAWPQPAFSH